jgi:hypothetical protein
MPGTGRREPCRLRARAPDHARFRLTSGDNACMADISIFVALISGSAGVAGAALSPLAIAFKEGRQAKRDRQERHGTAARQACVQLLAAAADLRTQVANNLSFRGDRSSMVARLEAVRGYASAAGLHAVSVSLLEDRLAESASRLGAAAKTYADAATTCTDLDKGWMVSDPDHRDLEEAINDFRKKAIAAVQGYSG